MQIRLDNVPSTAVPDDAVRQPAQQQPAPQSVQEPSPEPAQFTDYQGDPSPDPFSDYDGDLFSDYVEPDASPAIQHVDPKASTYQCPNCNGRLEFDIAKGKLVCAHCGSEYDEPEHKDASIPVGGGAAAAAPVGHVTDVQGFLERAAWDGGKVEELAGAVTYSCPSCGASVTADQSEVSIACPYCDNNMLVSGIATTANVPSKVLPFSITREQAEARMREHFEHKWYLSRAFDASLEHMKGVYVPYYLYDMDVQGKADYIAYYDSEDSDGNTVRYYYAAQRMGHASFSNIHVDGSSKMPDAHMDAIAPFSFERMNDFSPGYVAGYLMEVPDENPQQCYGRAQKRAENSLDSAMRSDICREKKVEGVQETVRISMSTDCTGVTSCVLPVWLMHCTWEDEQMLFAVNGETGKCVGDLPVARVRRALTCGITALVMALLVVLVTIGLVSGKADGDTLAHFVGGGVITTVVLTLLVDRHFMAQMRTAVETEDADDNYSGGGAVMDFRWISRKSYGSSNAAKRVFQEGERVGRFGGGADYPPPMRW